jgi:diguanylate cyclase (GGDEF)-like protein
MATTLRILLLEDMPDDAELEKLTLERAGIDCEIRCVENEADFVRQFEQFEPDLVLADFSLPTFDGLSALRLVRNQRVDLPFIFVSGTVGEEMTVELLRSGATDYVVKSNLARLPAAVQRAMGEAGERREQAQQEAQLARLTRVRAVQSAIDSAIVRIRDPHELFQAACNLAVELGGFRMAWVGRLASDASGMEPVAWSGHDAGYLDEITALPPATAEMCSRDCVVLRQDCTVIVEDIEHDPLFVPRLSALARGYRAMISLPLKVEGKASAVFRIISAEAGFFGDEESRILSDLADDLSFALDQRAREERLSQFAYHDMLTGMPNRRLLREHLTQELVRARRLKNTVALMFIDLDDFKTVNDTLGHSAGDKVLKEVSARIMSCIREGDMAARLGGDEFVMVLPIESGAETLEPMIQRVLESVSATIVVGRHRLGVRCSIGTASYPQDGKDSDTLLNCADGAMYRAKQQGRRNLDLFDEEAGENPGARLLTGNQ